MTLKFLLLISMEFLQRILVLGVRMFVLSGQAGKSRRGTWSRHYWHLNRPTDHADSGRRKMEDASESEIR